MIAIIAVAGLLALPSTWSVLAIALSIPCLAVIGAHWLVFRRNGRVAAFGFWFLAISSNSLYVAACVAPDYMLLPVLFIVWLVIVLPTVTSIGAAWIILSTREGAILQRSGPAAGLSLFVLAVLPVLTLWTLWPLRVAFFAARPTLERLADQVAAGQTIGFPRRVGMFQLAGSAVDPASGNVGLMIDPNPSGYTGFVRARPGTHGAGGPIIGSDLNVDLGGGWWYKGDD